MSRNAAMSSAEQERDLGSISSDGASALAFLAMRCDSTASWFAGTRSRAGVAARLRRSAAPPAAPARATALRLALIPSRPLPSAVRLASLPSSRSAAVSDARPAVLDGIEQVDEPVPPAPRRGSRRARCRPSSIASRSTDESLAAVLHRREARPPGPATRARCRARAAARASAFPSRSRRPPRSASVWRFVEEHHERREDQEGRTSARRAPGTA